MTTSLSKRPTVFAISLLSLFWVLTMWGIWEKGVYALGWNLTAFVIALFLVYSSESKLPRPTKHEYVWLVPLLLITLSYTLYENPYVKAVNMLVLPIVFVSYFIITSTKNHAELIWSGAWVSRIVERGFGFVNKIEMSITTIANELIPGGSKKSDLAKRIVIGLAILFFVSLVVIIPILSSANPAFLETMLRIYDFVLNLIELETLFKLFVFVVLTVSSLAGLFHWTQGEEFPVQKESKHMDAVISGIVLGGILVLYIVFLQLETFWVYTLPTEFLSTERLVKSGFWQLFFLSGINALLFVLYYRRTSKHVQNILIVFMVASLLLLLSAANKMGMYVYYYGFSYEKFFAAYTVIFSVFLFIRLIVSLFQKEKTDILRYLVVAFLWMYAVATVLPIEQIIFRANVALSRRPLSRINLHELEMLSGDAFHLGVVRNNVQPEYEWSNSWMERNLNISDEKQFFEKTFTDLFL